MKKFMLFFLSAICIAGVVALGYLVFNAKSVASIEIEGQMQTIYVAGQDIDFEKSKLKVTYKNGNVKFVDMGNKNVKISQFSTSLKTHGTMKITYKSHILEVDYDVIESGMYYLSSDQSFYANGSTTTPKIYKDAKSSPTLIYLRKNGQLDYYYLDSISARYCMHDGSYDNTYKYEIVGDSLNAYLGSKDNVIEIKADYNAGGTVEYKFTKVYTNSQGLNTSKNVKIFKHYEMKSDEYRTITNSSVDLSRVPNKQGDYVVFDRGDTIASSGYSMYLIVSYGNDHFMTNVCVHICDGMIQGNSFNTNKYTDASTMYIYYTKGAGQAQHAIHYRVS